MERLHLDDSVNEDVRAFAASWLIQRASEARGRATRLLPRFVEFGNAHYFFFTGFVASLQRTEAAASIQARTQAAGDCAKCCLHLHYLATLGPHVLAA
jgi:hypothetical protein